MVRQDWGRVVLTGMAPLQRATAGSPVMGPLSVVQVRNRGLRRQDSGTCGPDRA